MLLLITADLCVTMSPHKVIQVTAKTPPGNVIAWSIEVWNCSLSGYGRLNDQGQGQQMSYLSAWLLCMSGSVWVFQKLYDQWLSFLSGSTFHFHIEGHPKKKTIKNSLPKLKWLEITWQLRKSRRSKGLWMTEKWYHSQGRILGLPLHSGSMMCSCATWEC